MFLFRPATARQTDVGLLVLRIVLGVVFMAHGYQKLFTFGIAGVTASFTQMGAPLPDLTAPLVSLLEFFGGAALIVGLLTRLVSLGLVGDMLGAIMLVHLKNGFFAPKGVEFVLTLMAGALALFFTGAGRFAIDAMIGGRQQRPAGRA